MALMKTKGIGSTQLSDNEITEQLINALHSFVINSDEGFDSLYYKNTSMLSPLRQSTVPG